MTATEIAQAGTMIQRALLDGDIATADKLRAQLSTGTIALAEATSGAAPTPAVKPAATVTTVSNELLSSPYYAMLQAEAAKRGLTVQQLAEQYNIATGELKDAVPNKDMENIDIRYTLGKPVDATKSFAAWVKGIGIEGQLMLAAAAALLLFLAWKAYKK